MGTKYTRGATQSIGHIIDEGNVGETLGEQNSKLMNERIQKLFYRQKLSNGRIRRSELSVDTKTNKNNFF